ncbi:SufE family protein [Chitinibacter sp. GC72]|uniref:SufE family protein n=1 Tax=Chitinibacter sp. GC72 TaxID=1526917 RepID=UPI0012F71E09|nr:SufE family protein [Chitinibacter sp. GC72]
MNAISASSSTSLEPAASEHADPRFAHPFGNPGHANAIDLAELARQLDAAASWEAKNRLLVQLAKQLPDWSPEQKTPDRKVAGCESQVWLAFSPIKQAENNVSWQLAADSDSRIVKGLLALVLTAYNQRSDSGQFDFEAWLNERGMQRFLSASRGNGLRAITRTISEHWQNQPQPNRA